SPAPVKRRIERLERLEGIVGYSLGVDRAKLEGSLEAVTELQFVGNTAFEDIVASAAAIPGGQEPFTTAGHTDAPARIPRPDVEPRRQVFHRLPTSSHITSTRTLMVLDSWSRA